MESTTSQIKAFKSCRRLYELQYIELLRPKVESEALTTGSSYHRLVEGILKGVECPSDGIPAIMASQFKALILPCLPEIEKVEYQFNVKIGRGKSLIGKIDAICEDGTPVEHKTTSDTIDEKYIHRLNWDDQVTNYLLALSLERKEIINKVIYTVIKKPTIRLKQNETMEDYLKRCVEWYEDDTEHKVATFPVIRSKDDLVEKQAELVHMFKEMKSCKCFYRNPSHCSIMGCSYASVCLSYTPEAGAVDFVKKTKVNEELEGGDLNG